LLTVADTPGIDIEHLRNWVGQTQVREEFLSAFPAAALAGLLEWPERPADGDSLRLPWHWLYFLDTPGRSEIGPDGHPKRGGFLPPVPLERRMWVAGKLQSLAPLIIGRPARKVSQVRSVDLKQGKSGPMIFVTVSHEISQDDLCISEEQNIVYRDLPISAQPLPPGETPQHEAAWTKSLVPDASMLFRFSALTYNGHRIHYDPDYAVDCEFYPGLVVHGPLLATLLLDLQYQHNPTQSIASFKFRAVRPAFCDEPLSLAGRPVAQGAELWTCNSQGFVGMAAQATFDNRSFK
jgi:3-methylfumaryl-CoA hydratase